MPHIGMNFTAEIRSDQLMSHGVDWGRPLEILFRKGNQLVLRRKGHMTWSGVGMPFNYAETLYMRVELGAENISARDSVNGRAFTRDFAVVLAYQEPGHKWRPVLQKLIADATSGGTASKARQGSPSGRRAAPRAP